MNHIKNSIDFSMASITRTFSGLLMVATCLAMIATTAQAQTQAEADATASAKTIVIAFFDLAFVQGKPTEAALRYISPNTYIQHNPMVADGRDAFLKVMPGWIKTSGRRSTIKRVIAENDLVVIHASVAVQGEKDGPTKAVTDIFRVENGLIVEHWDVVQEVPKESANKNTMF